MIVTTVSFVSLVFLVFTVSLFFLISLVSLVSLVFLVSLVSLISFPILFNFARSCLIYIFRTDTDGCSFCYNLIFFTSFNFVFAYFVCVSNIHTNLTFCMECSHHY